MQTVTLTGNVDGSIIPGSLDDPERGEWYDLSKAALARAYSDDEPDYPANLVRPRFDRLWATEAKRRRDEVRQGCVQTIPGDEALARVRRSLGR